MFILVILLILSYRYILKSKSCKPKFKETLEDAKKILDSIGVKFHLHSGTALGAIREKDFIKHDLDIDLAVFREDYKDEIVKSMEKCFYFKKQYGKVDNGLELKFVHKKYNIGLDIFLLYRKGDKLKQSVYNCKSNRFEKGSNSDNECIMYVKYYKPVLIKFLGKLYNCAPISFLIDRYGKDWKTPKIFNYQEGLNKNYGTL